MVGDENHGQSAADPSGNVLALVQASSKRQDDLRAMEAAHQKEVAELREAFAQLALERESSRLDAIHKVDITAVARAADVSTVQATTLANQVAASAETLRGQVTAAAQAAQASSISLAAALEPMQRSIDDLRRAQYETAGGVAKGSQSKAGSQWAVSFAVSAVLAILALIGFVVTNR